MINLLRKFLRPTLREQLEDGVREALRRYAERHMAPNLKVFVSTDLIDDGVDPAMWAQDEAESLRRFALQWAEDNQVPRAGLRLDVVLLDTKRNFAFVKPVALEVPPIAAPGSPPPGGAGATSGPAGRAPRSLAGAASRNGGTAILEVVESPDRKEPLTVTGEVTVGRKGDGPDVVGLGDRYMSARHARFHVAAGRLYITDLDSKNRTYLNDRPLPPHEAVPASVGDQVRLGTTTLRITRVGG